MLSKRVSSQQDSVIATTVLMWQPIGHLSTCKVHHPSAINKTRDRVFSIPVNGKNLAVPTRETKFDQVKWIFLKNQKKPSSQAGQNFQPKTKECWLWSPENTFAKRPTKISAHF